ncbi:putative 2-oxoglutarate-dependent dioxygenase AOP1 [Canna indica]|uniref:2-oxoglutarate-dependent dioxygenase AOP1 n=1 Tax=Canna indica TaxID=4628 RepID=A0AAQ3KB79_9LILI|nr:putative 2-oxoglutarate-dependent dioxygenase AOP1 [Canna indica]
MQQKHLPTVDFTAVDPGSPGAWRATREQVMQALGFHGGFEVVYDRVTPDHRHALLEIAKDLFARPLPTKLKNASDEPYGGYLGQLPGIAYESLAVADAGLPYAIPTFADLMWPDGNPRFCEKVKLFTEKMVELLETVRRMVMESLGVAEYFEEQVRATYYQLRFTEYGEASEWAEEKRTLAQMAHRDTNTLTVVCQLNEVNGLQVEAKDGEWVLAAPRSPASFFVIAGEAFQAWTNNKVYAPRHGVRVEDEEVDRRYCIIVFAKPTSEHPIEAPAELVDDLHPSLFKPFYYHDFLKFCVSPEGRKQRTSRLAVYRRSLTTAPPAATTATKEEDEA